MAKVVMLNPHERMTPKECLSYCTIEHAEYQDVIVVGYDSNGEVIVRSSEMTRAEATFMLMAALDHARGK